MDDNRCGDGDEERAADDVKGTCHFFFFAGSEYLLEINENCRDPEASHNYFTLMAPLV